MLCSASQEIYLVRIDMFAAEHTARCLQPCSDGAMLSSGLPPDRGRRPRLMAAARSPIVFVVLTAALAAVITVQERHSRALTAAITVQEQHSLQGYRQDHQPQSYRQDRQLQSYRQDRRSALQLSPNATATATCHGTVVQIISDSNMGMANAMGSIWYVCDPDEETDDSRAMPPGPTGGTTSK